MNGKKAKLIRRAARDMATATVTQQETQYDHKSRKNPGTLVVASCERTLIKQVKAMHTKGIPSKTFDDVATNAIVA